MPKQLYILLVIIVIVVGTKYFLRNTETDDAVIKTSNPILSYAEIRNNFLNKDYSYFNNDEVASAIIEFKYQNELHSLILVRDSIAFLITKNNTIIDDEPCTDSLINLSNNLLNTLNNQIQPNNSFLKKKPFTKDNRILIKYKIDNNLASKINIDAENVNHTEYINLIKTFLDLISYIKNKDLLITDIIQLNNEIE